MLLKCKWSPHLSEQRAELPLPVLSFENRFNEVCECLIWPGDQDRPCLWPHRAGSPAGETNRERNVCIIKKVKTVCKHCQVQPSPGRSGKASRKKGSLDSDLRVTEQPGQVGWVTHGGRKLQRGTACTSWDRRADSLVEMGEALEDFFILSGYIDFCPKDNGIRACRAQLWLL